MEFSQFVLRGEIFGAGPVRRSKKSYDLNLNYSRITFVRSSFINYEYLQSMFQVLLACTCVDIH